MEQNNNTKSGLGVNTFSVDVTDFFYNANQTKQKLESRPKKEILTEYEKTLIDELMTLVKEVTPDKVEILETRLSDLSHLSESISRFPSLLERRVFTDSVGTPESLIDSLIRNPDPGDPIFQLPSKATLGKGFLISKTHTLASLTKLSVQVNAPIELTQKLNNLTVESMSSLLVEDVYLSLIRDDMLRIEYRREWAQSLLLLWEHWTDETAAYVAPVLQKLWNARRQLAPAFGTMMGTSELFLISVQMDEDWMAFIKQKLGDASFSQAMEEFLFGISHEQITKLKLILKEKGIPAIGRDEVSSFLHQRLIADKEMDYRDFYSLYTVRRDNARARKSLGLQGPHNTIEDYFVQFITDREKSKAKS